MYADLLVATEMAKLAIAIAVVVVVRSVVLIVLLKLVRCVLFGLCVSVGIVMTEVLCIALFIMLTKRSHRSPGELER